MAPLVEVPAAIFPRASSATMPMVSWAPGPAQGGATARLRALARRYGPQEARGFGSTFYHIATAQF